MSAIQLSTFQPFSSRVGRDVVLQLRFSYDPTVVDLIKAALQEAKSLTPGTTPGGWLPEYKAWFVELPAWPIVRRRLLQAGHTLVGDLLEYLNGAKKDLPRQPPPSHDTSVLPMSTVRQGVQRWYSELSREFHPDCGGHPERMVALNLAAERLRNLLGV